MMSTSPTDVQLEHLERVLTEIAAAEGYAMYSPFADRHGAAQCRFLRQVNAGTTQIVGVGCDVREGMQGLLCEFSAGVSSPAGSRSRAVQTIPLTGSPGTKGLLRNCFHLAAREADTLCDLLARRNGVEQSAPTAAGPFHRASASAEAIRIGSDVVEREYAVR